MKVRLLLVCLTLAATIAAAQEMPKPSPKLKELNYFAGTWSCKGETFDTDFTKAHPTMATVKASWILSDFWLSLNYTEEKTAKNPMPYALRLFWGYNEGEKKLVSGSVDNQGSYSTESTDGWDGMKMTLTGATHGGGMTTKVHDYFEKKSANKLVHWSDYETKDGSWKKVDEETCTRK
jgi:hypothetical protein